MADVFVSYSRADSEFVGRLTASIQGSGKDVWVDTEGIADAEVFPEAIKRAIEQSDAFLFVITPASVQSAYCEHEVEHARDMNKRIVPVLRDPVSDSQLPAEIRDRNWIPFTDDGQFDPSMARLVKALDTDLEAARAHTRWLVKALEWDAEARDKSFLLRGSELKAAEGWLASSPERADPAPTALQREYLLASREAAARRQRLLVSGSLAVAVLSIGLVIFALISRSQAVSEQVGARAQALAAESQAELPDDPEISLILGVKAVRERATPQSLFALRAALDASPLERALPTVTTRATCGINSGLSAAVSPNGRQIVEGTCDGSLLLLDAGTGRVVRAEHVAAHVTTVLYSPNGSLLAVGTDLAILLVNPRSGAVLARTHYAVPAGGPGVTALAFSPDGRQLASNAPNGVALLSVPGLRARLLAKYPAAGGGMVFTRDGKELVAGGAYDNAFEVFDVATGRLVRRVVSPTPGMTGSWPEVVALSPDGSELAVGYPTLNSVNGTVSIYSTRTWAKQFDVTTISNVEVSAVAFSPDGTRLAIGAEDGTAGVWSLLTREQLVSYAGPTAAVTAMAFTAGGRSVLTASNDGIVRLWRALGGEQAFVPVNGNIDWLSVAPGLLAVVEDAYRKTSLATFRLPGGRPLQSWAVGPFLTTGISLSQDARYLVTYASTAGTNTGAPASGPVRIWSVATHRVVRTLPRASVALALMSPDDSRLFLLVGVTRTGIGKGEVVNLATGHVVTLGLATPPCGYFPPDVAFSSDDRRIAGGSFCGFADVWSATTGRLLRQVNEGGEISSAGLSPDGSRLLVSSWDSRATIWSVASGSPLVELIGHTRGIAGAVFAAGGSLVVSDALDHTVRVWNASTGLQLRVLTFTALQGTIAVSADGSQLAIGENTPILGVDDVVRVFDTCPACQNPTSLLALAVPRVTNRLTTLESTVIKKS